MPDNPDRKLALDAVDEAFAAAIQNLVGQLQVGLIDSHGNESAVVARFEAGLGRAKQARQLAIAGVGKILG